MTQVKRADTLGTLSDQTTFARLSDARVTVGGRQYVISQLDSSAYSGLTNGQIYQVYVTAPSATPALVIAQTAPGTAYKQVGEMHVGASAAKTFTDGTKEDRFPEAGKRQTVKVDQSVMDFSLLAGTATISEAEGTFYVDSDGNYTGFVRIWFTSISSDVNFSASTFSAEDRQSMSGTVPGNFATDGSGNFFADFDTPAGDCAVAGIIRIVSKPSFFDEYLDV